MVDVGAHSRDLHNLLGNRAVHRLVCVSRPRMKNKLRVLRAERDWSQQELGMRVGVSRQAINAVETGKFDPSLPLAMKVARAFDTTVEAIFTLDEDTP